MLKASSTMTKNLIKVGPDDSILLAYRLMFEKGIRHLPVFDHQNMLVGMLSDRDIQRAMIVDRHTPEIQEISLNANIKVREYMNWPVHSVQDQTSLRSVVSDMMERKISAVLVQNEQYEFVGIVTTEDLLAQLLKEMDKDEDMKEKSLLFFLPNTLY